MPNQTSNTNRPAGDDADGMQRRSSLALSLSCAYRRSFKHLGGVVLASAIVLAAASAQSAFATQVTQFPLEPNSKPGYITQGPEGNLWFSDNGTYKLGRLLPSGQLSEFELGLPKNADLLAITTGPEGDLWFAGSSGHEIGRSTTEGTITTFPTGIAGSPDVYGIARGPEGNMWFTANTTVEQVTTGHIGYIEPATGVVKQVKTLEGEVTNIVAGPDQNLWFTDSGTAEIDRITPSGGFSHYGPLGECLSGAVTPCPQPTSIAVGSEGNLWVNELRGKSIDSITTSGKITPFTGSISTTNVEVVDLAAGPEGNMWFTEDNDSAVGYITPQGAINIVASGASGSGAYGITSGPEGNLWFTEPKAGKIAEVTPNVRPVVSTGGVSGAATSGATVSGTVRSRGTDTHYHFQYGTTSEYGASTAESDNGSGDGVQGVSTGVGGLAPGTTYHYRIVASNQYGTSYGADQTFTTQPPPRPAPKVSVNRFEMYFSGSRHGKKMLRLNQLVVIELTAGERVTFVCERCHGSSTHGTQIAHASKVTFHTRDLLVAASSLVQITVTAPDGSKRVRTYRFLITHAETEIKNERCYLPHSSTSVTCPGSPPQHSTGKREHKTSVRHRHSTKGKKRAKH
jgi:streptogramin lyase